MINVNQHPFETQKIITSDLYKGSIIEKAYGGGDEGLISAELIRVQLNNKLEKGIISEELHGKAMEQLDNILEKGKRGVVGEIREWKDGKYKKTSTGWVPMNEKAVGDIKEFRKEHDGKLAWNNRFENIDRILSLHYDEMKESDRNLKDEIFGRYYRYFNDGDVKAFPSLKKIGVDEDSINVLKNNRSAVAHGQKPGNYKDREATYRYEQAMENVVTSAMKYFKEKYPNFFSQEGRQKTIDSWKKQVYKYATGNPTSLDSYWVAEFGKQFGSGKLKKYDPYLPENKEKSRRIESSQEIKEVLSEMIDKFELKKAYDILGIEYKETDSLEKASKGEGSKGGHVIGHTKSGKPVYAGKEADHKDHKDFSAQDHLDAAQLHHEKHKQHSAEAYNSSNKGDFASSLSAKHTALSAHHSRTGVAHEMQAKNQIEKEHESGLSGDEKKIIADQKKKQLDHHNRMSDFHKTMLDSIKKYKEDKSTGYGSQATQDAIQEAEHHHQKQFEHHDEQANAHVLDATIALSKEKGTSGQFRGPK